MVASILSFFHNVSDPSKDVHCLTHYQTTNFWFKLKQLADNNLKFNENSMKFSKWIENTVGKVEIARYEQFLLFPKCFQ